MTDDHAADRKVRLDHTRAPADMKQAEERPQEDRTLESEADAVEADALRIVRAI